jgi:Tfp pilus assembly protein PilP
MPISGSGHAADSTATTQDLHQYKAQLSERAKQELAQVKAPRQYNQEFESFWSGAVDETIAQIDAAEDVTSAASIYNTASARAQNVREVMQDFERVRVTGRGKKKGTGFIDTLAQLWNRASGGAGEYNLVIVYGLIF